MRSFRRVVESTAPVEEVFELLTSQRWAGILAEHLGDDTRLVRRDVGADGSVTLELSRNLPSGVPPFLQKLLPADPRVVTVDVWGPSREGRRECRWTADIAGTPASLSGTQVLEPWAGGNRHVVEGAVRVGIPLVGGRAEAFVAEKCGLVADLEADVVRKLLDA